LLARRAVEHGSKQGSTLVNFVLINTVPCILHLENRVGLKLLRVVLEDGLATVVAKKILKEKKGVEGGRIQAYLTAINRVVNHEMLGSEDSPAQWKCPYDEEKQEISFICMDNTRIRKVVEGFYRLIGGCFPKRTKEESQWKKVIKFYKKAINRLRSRDDLTRAQVYLFQKDADIFFQEWVALHGVEGITNYIHMLGSGHLAEYLFYWKNLYQHSQ
jgi:hypothetical protein